MQIILLAHLEETDVQLILQAHRLTLLEEAGVVQEIIIIQQVFKEA